MASDLISRGFVMLDYLDRLGRKDSYKAKFEALCEAVDNAPAVDAVEVVRCKDCIYHGRCTYEAVFITSGFENPYCCAGWRKEKKDAVD